MKNRSLPAQVLSGLLLTAVTLALTACGQVIYKEPANNFAGRPIPPSGLLQRVLAAYTANGSQGGLEILDGLRDIRSNVQNTKPTFSISGYSAAEPITIINYPEQTTGYVYSQTDGSLGSINYSKESSNGSAASLGAYSPSVAASTDGTRFAGASEASGLLIVTTGGVSYSLNLPNVDKVVINRGNTIILAMVRNSNSLYRVVKLPASNNPVVPPGSIDCEPILLPVLCVVPVAGAYDRPVDAYFSVDGNSAYILNCGAECGGAHSSITFIQTGALTVDNIPTVNPLGPGAASPLLNLPVANPVPIPGGVTAALSDGTTLYVAGQQLQSSGLFAGNLSTVNLTSYTVSGPYSISDGNHTKMLFADDNTLWIGSQQCANGARAALAAQQLAAGQPTTQAANYNCLTEVTLGGATPSISVIPTVTQQPAGSTTAPVTVLNPNTDLNNYYYGSLTGICWVQNYHKVFTAYGGQIHAFYTGGAITDENDPAHGTTPASGSEMPNFYITVQGNVLDVAYMDALTNSAN